MLPPDKSWTGDAVLDATRDWFCDGFKEWMREGRREAFCGKERERKKLKNRSSFKFSVSCFDCLLEYLLTT